MLLISGLGMVAAVVLLIPLRMFCLAAGIVIGLPYTVVLLVVSRSQPKRAASSHHDLALAAQLDEIRGLPETAPRGVTEQMLPSWTCLSRPVE